MYTYFIRFTINIDGEDTTASTIVSRNVPIVAVNPDDNSLTKMCEGIRNSIKQLHPTANVGSVVDILVLNFLHRTELENG